MFSANFLPTFSAGQKKACMVFFLGLMGLYTLRKLCEYSWGRCRSKRSMAEKTVIITGANSGIGKATAMELARRGARVIMACHSVSSALIAAAEVRQITSIDKVILRYLDLASFTSIRAFAKYVHEHEARVDVLINNAAVYNCDFMRTADGLETQMEVNYLGHFLLTNLLLDVLKASRPSRIIVVTSLLYVDGRIQLPDLVMNERNYDARQAYADSKLACALLVRELSKRLQGTGVTSYAVSPGLVNTSLGRYSKISWYSYLILLPLSLFLLRTPEQGCQTVVDCAVDEKYEKESGMFYRNCRMNPWHPTALDAHLARDLWNTSKLLTEQPASPPEPEVAQEALV
ncbi:retinol dehydrogenase 13-like isoform X1 [Ornithodoros turicata]|uniref:retinol dehydrogenase 13-like isoform X1 n=2 Tax=Ornithodoros turicata TaxID=34597 RepID=UPI0031388EA9